MGAGFRFVPWLNGSVKAVALGSEMTSLRRQERGGGEGTREKRKCRDEGGGTEGSRTARSLSSGLEHWRVLSGRNVYSIYKLKTTL